METQERNGHPLADGVRGVAEGEVFLSWRDLTDHAQMVSRRLSELEVTRVAATVRSGIQLIISLMACRDLNLDAVITGPGAPQEAVARLDPDCFLEIHPERSADTVISQRRPAGARAGRKAGDGGLWIFSSGTTGHPRATRWGWPDLTRGAVWSPETQSGRWGIGYAPFTFAGVAAACQAMRRVGTIEFLDPGGVASSPGRAAELDIVGATPSFWRMASILLLRRGEAPRTIKMASMTGEPVDQPLIDLLKSVCGVSRVRQIFGTAEFGLLLVIDDEKPGIPRGMVGVRLPRGVTLDVKDGLLFVSPGIGKPLRKTGDYADVTDDRIYIRGRTENSINVGGKKVDPATVSHVIQQHHEVLAARAYPVRNAILGNVVGLDVVIKNPRDAGNVTADLKSYAQRNLEPHECPQRVKIVDDLRMAVSRKVHGGE